MSDNIPPSQQTKITAVEDKETSKTRTLRSPSLNMVLKNARAAGLRSGKWTLERTGLVQRAKGVVKRVVRRSKDSKAAKSSHGQKRSIDHATKASGKCRYIKIDNVACLRQWLQQSPHRPNAIHAHTPRTPTQLQTERRRNVNGPSVQKTSLSNHQHPNPPPQNPSAQSNPASRPHSRSRAPSHWRDVVSR